MSLVISMTIYVCVVLSTNKRDKPDCLVVFVTELNWPVLNICTPSSFYTFENKMFGFVLPWTLSLAVRWACSNHSPILCRELDKAYFCHSESEERVLREPLFNQPPVSSAQNQPSTISGLAAIQTLTHYATYKCCYTKITPLYVSYMLAIGCMLATTTTFISNTFEHTQIP